MDLTLRLQLLSVRGKNLNFCTGSSKVLPHLREVYIVADTWSPKYCGQTYLYIEVMEPTYKYKKAV